MKFVLQLFWKQRNPTEPIAIESVQRCYRRYSVMQDIQRTSRVSFRQKIIIHRALMMAASTFLTMCQLETCHSEQYYPKVTTVSCICKGISGEGSPRHHFIYDPWLIEKNQTSHLLFRVLWMWPIGQLLVYRYHVSEGDLKGQKINK